MFKDRTPARADAQLKSMQAADQALAELLQSRSLRSHRLSRNCEIGPFVLDYVIAEASLVIELQPCAGMPDRHNQARTAFLSDMGYRIVYVPRQEIVLHPKRVLARIHAALQRRAREG